MKTPLAILTLISAFTLSANATITTYAEYRLGEDGVIDRPRDLSINARHFGSGAGTQGSVGTANLSPATVTTAVLRTDEVATTIFNGDMSLLPTDDFAVGIYAYIPTATAATEGHVFSFGPRSAGVLRIALEAGNWVANYRTVDGGNDVGIPVGDPVPVTLDTWVHLAVIRTPAN